MARYIVIDDFCEIYTWAITDGDGYLQVFDNKEEAENEASQLQNGKVLEIP